MNRALIYILIATISISLAKAKQVSSKDVHQYQTWVDSATAAYQQKKYAKAVEFYQRVLKFGMSSADLHYNIGNAYYKQGITPFAILHYEKALKYNPAYEDARVNLQMANSFITDRIEPAHIPFYKQWYKQLWRLMPANSWAIWSIISLIIVLGSVFVFIFSRSIIAKKTVLPIGILAFIFIILSIIMGNEAKLYLENTHNAILVEPSLNVKSSPAESGTDLFRIHEGLKLNIRQGLGEWSEIAIPDGRVGWIPTKSFEKI